MTQRSWQPRNRPVPDPVEAEEEGDELAGTWQTPTTQSAPQVDWGWGDAGWETYEWEAIPTSLGWEFSSWH